MHQVWWKETAVKYRILFNDDKTQDVEFDNVLYTPSHMEFQRKAEVVSILHTPNQIMKCVAIVPWGSFKIAEPIGDDD